ncbi:amino acid ABC transporter periplasmic substrate-binding protein [Paramagnetospirillum magnetotacticum MS-1]|uniref:Amino acid ABC transporter periplasmic substrate-binding protein n=1 Tax=Paramagnetospirillum magnetotacticum MS-1 TaxID=272627 RepID=A0A0C2YWI8_PARME|nr:transporter substrate-binding domain-containing protein [Paramagnetospirillum magnetotacticum]KIL99488.1 amino acid ABC transporter periplasmic substrate-binding protein [Paramagnetospirillum magnetotacticum MS-1]
MIRCLFILAGLLMASLASGGGASAASLDDIQAKGELTVAVYRDFPPFSSRQGGKLVGIDIDLAKALAKRLKLKAGFMELTAGESVDDDLRNAVWKGHYLERRVADVMMHVPNDRVFALRNNNAVIFAPYFRERVAVARNPDKVTARDDVTVFERERVGVELATLADVYLTNQLGHRFVANVVHFPNLGAAAQALAKGEVAAVMGNQAELTSALSAHGKRFPIGPMTAPGLTQSTWELGLAVKDSNRQLSHPLDDAITRMRADGTIAAIFKRYGLTYLPPEG